MTNTIAGTAARTILLILGMCLLSVAQAQKITQSVNCTPTTEVTVRAKSADEKPLPTAVVQPHAILRGAPVLLTPDQQAVAVGTVVNLRAPFKNDDGNWWYVSVKGVGAGWFLATDLGDFRAAGARP